MAWGSGGYVEFHRHHNHRRGFGTANDGWDCWPSRLVLGRHNVERDGVEPLPW